jgi:histidinol-phosphatase (PHP family)
MSYVDTHNHQRIWSPDAGHGLDEIVKEAKDLGLLGITLTDHYDYNGVPNDWCLDASAYAPFMESMRRDDKIPYIYTGIELDYQEEHRDHLLFVATNYDFDHILISKHFILGIDPYSSPELVKSTFGDLKTYADTVIREIAKSADDLPGNTVAHYCYCSRYAPWKKSKFTYALAPDAFDLLFKTLITNGQALEINLQTVDKLLARGYSFEDALPDKAIFYRYFEMGGRLITIASDAHYPGQLAKHSREVIALLKDAGFTHLTHFVRRKAILTPIT